MAEPEDTELRITPLSVEQIDDILQLEAGATPYCWTRNDWLTSLENDDCFQLLEADSLVAVVALSLVCDEASLLNIVVSKAAQGRGYGAYLLEYCLDIYASRGIKHCFLEVRRSNHPAIRLYERLGFELIGERKNYYPVEGGREDALVLLCRLDQSSEAKLNEHT